MFLAQKVVFFYYLSEKNETDCLQLGFPCPDNNLLENYIRKSLEPNRLSGSSSFAYLCNNKSCCD